MSVLPPPAPGVKARPPSPPGGRRRARWQVAAAAAGAAVVAGTAGVLVGVAIDRGGEAPARSPVVAPGRPTAGLLPVADVVDAVGPSVVTISSDVQLGRAVGTGVIVSA